MPYPTDKTYRKFFAYFSGVVISTGRGNIWLVVEKAVFAKHLLDDEIFNYKTENMAETVLM